jgi:gliding motility-associated lipoprotein GldD
MGGVINITYKQITPQQPLIKLVQDAESLSFLHHSKTDYINEQAFSRGNVSGVLYTVDGNVASKYQFAATDSIKNFLRGGLYFDVTPNADSLKPVTDFLEKDMEHLLFTLRWKKN